MRSAGGPNSNAALATKAHIESFRTPLADGSGAVRFRWKKPHDAIPFEMKVAVEGDPDRVRAELWTNADHNARPGDFYPVPMGPAQRNGNLLTFKRELPIDKVGNYRAVGRITTDDGKTWQWMSGSGIRDTIFRVRSAEHERINMREIHVGMANYDSGPKFSTFDDLTEDGAYNLKHLADEGVNMIWVMCPFFTTRWEGSNPEDVAGSPFAARDFFSVDHHRLSKAALQLPESDEEGRRAAAMKEFKRMVDRAHELGIKVVLDIALNHVGHDFIFRDLFETDHGLTVMKNNFSQIAVNPEQLATIEQKLADPSIQKTMERLLPAVYAKWDDQTQKPAPDGASKVEEIAVGGWGKREYLNWTDCKQLNHGAAWSEGFNHAESAEQNKVVDWLGRVLTFWSVEMGIDGFRLDHGQGLPDEFYERTLNQVQAATDKYVPGKHLFFMPEDHNRASWTGQFTDAVQTCTWMGDLMSSIHNVNLDQLWGVLNNPEFRQPLGSPSHDEARIGNSFNGDLDAVARFQSFMTLLGGPSIGLMGDELAEGQPLLFKQYTGVPTLMMARNKTLPASNESMRKTIARAGRAKAEHEAFATANRARLFTASGQGAGGEGAIAGVARWSDEGRTALMFANLKNDRARQDIFRLDEASAARIDPARRYQARDLLAADPKAGLWGEGVLGADLIKNGVFVRLRPYQIQALALDPIAPEH